MKLPMKNLLIVCSMLLFATLLMGCEKKDVSPLDGTYSGTFTVASNDTTLTGPTTIELKNGTFSATGNSNKIPAGGSGTFSVDNNTIRFKDANIWTANFDWNLILSGSYEYTIDGKKLTIAAEKNGVGIYQYVLEKQ